MTTGDNLKAEDVTPSCKCWIIGPHERCPIHLLDRSETTQNPSRKPRDSGRVVNTTDSLRKA